MATKHYYAMYTPDGYAVDSNGTPIGEVKMFDRKHERDKWVALNFTRNGKMRQTRTITEHEARVTMLRQYKKQLFEAHELRFKMPCYTYREYAQYYPTALMYDDYKNSRLQGLTATRPDLTHNNNRVI